MCKKKVAEKASKKVLNVSFVEERTTTLTIFDASTRINPLDNTSGEDNSRLENDQAWEEEVTDKDEDDNDDMLTQKRYKMLYQKTQKICKPT